MSAEDLTCHCQKVFLFICRGGNTQVPPYSVGLVVPPSSPESSAIHGKLGEGTGELKVPYGKWSS